ncbi:MAG: sigma-54 interaction domain-containing protein [Caulobacteraceae bacterium]
MATYDILCFLDDDWIVRAFEFESILCKEAFYDIWQGYQDKKVNEFLKLDLDTAQGYTDWKGEIFQYSICKNRLGTGYILSLTKELDKLKIYEQAMDHFNEGVQIYDRNGYLIYLNEASKRIEQLENANVIGKHLLDIYSLDEDYSTTLTTLRQCAPVVNRCDIFKTMNGDTITTLNTAYPLFVDNKLSGAVAIVDDLKILKELWDKNDALEEFLLKHGKNSAVYKKSQYYTFDNLIGETSVFKEAIELARKVAVRDCEVLICGETGTGKELFAQSIHSASKMRDHEFVAINCAAIPESLMEGILFGTVKGAFTGSTDRIGLFEQAKGGTLFLDEINSMSLTMQTKLLRVLQEKKFRRVGGLKDIECDVRIISSCNEDPFDAIKDNRMRRDLFFRLSTVTINIPELKKRKDDIPLLVNYFIQKLSERYQKKVKKVSNNVIECFKEYSWPGNIRELYHAIEYAFNVMEGDAMDIAHLPEYLRELECMGTKDGDFNCKEILQLKSLERIMEVYEKRVLKNVLAKYDNNISKAAEALDIKRQSLQYRVKKYGI